MISELENKKNYLLERSKSIKNYKISILKKQKEIFEIYQKKASDICQGLTIYLWGYQPI
jgi:hypothetical protein